MVGGVILHIDTVTNNNELDTLFVLPEAHSKGIGYGAWLAIEALHPETKVWKTCTPYFDKRNIHFYVNNWEKLTDSERDELARNTAIRSYNKGEYLTGLNESCLGMIYILNGSIRTLIISEEGREITLFRLKPRPIRISRLKRQKNYLR